MNATHNAPAPYEHNETALETAWCFVCKKFEKFFKCGNSWYCTCCHYLKGTDGELAVMNE